MNYPHLASRIFNTPLLIHPAKLNAILAGLGGRLLGAEGGLTIDLRGAPDGAPDQVPAELFERRRGERRSRESSGGGYRVVDDVALVAARGVLAHRTKVDANSALILGYQQIARDLDAAAADSDVRAIVLALDSPGGEVSGIMELAEVIAEASAAKPVYALADTMALSAGYWIAAAAREVIVAPTGYLGSIGVVITHVDVSRALANDGVAVTHIYAGAHKVDGSPYQPLPDGVRADLQAEVDGWYRDFVAHVANARRLSPETVRGTEARTYRAQAAVDLGLADRIATPDALISELVAERPRAFQVGPLARPPVDQGAIRMSDNDQAGAPQAQPATAAGQPAEQQDTAAIAAAEARGREAGAAEERARIFAILDHPQAEGRAGAARVLARQPGLAAETAGEILAELVKDDAKPAAAPAAATPFERHMAALGNPQVGPDDEPAVDEHTNAAALWDRVVAKYN